MGQIYIYFDILTVWRGVGGVKGDVAGVSVAVHVAGPFPVLLVDFWLTFQIFESHVVFQFRSLSAGAGVIAPLGVRRCTLRAKGHRLLHILPPAEAWFLVNTDIINFSGSSLDLPSSSWVSGGLALGFSALRRNERSGGARFSRAWRGWSRE